MNDYIVSLREVSSSVLYDSYFSSVLVSIKSGLVKFGDGWWGLEDRWGRKLTTDIQLPVLPGDFSGSWKASMV